MIKGLGSFSGLSRIPASISAGSSPYDSLTKAKSIGPRKFNDPLNWIVEEEPEPLNPKAIGSIGPRKGSPILDSMRDALNTNPALQALQTLVPGGAYPMIGALQPSQRLERAGKLRSKLRQRLLDSGNKSEWEIKEASKIFTRARDDINTHPNISGYLDDYTKELDPNNMGSLNSWEKSAERLKTRGQPVKGSLFMMSIDPTSGLNTTRHEYGHLAREIKNPDLMTEYPTDKKLFGYKLHPEEIRARAIGEKVPNREMLDLIKSKSTPDIYPQARKNWMEQHQAYPKRLEAQITKAMMQEKDPYKLISFNSEVRSNFPELAPEVIDNIKANLDSRIKFTLRPSFGEKAIHTVDKFANWLGTRK